MADEILDIIGGNHTEQREGNDNDKKEHSDSDGLDNIEILSVSDNAEDGGISDFLETKSESDTEWKIEAKDEPAPVHEPELEKKEDPDGDLEQFLVAKSPSLLDKNDSDNESDDMEITKMLRPITPELDEPEPDQKTRPDKETLRYVLQEKFIKSLVCP